MQESAVHHNTHWDAIKALADKIGCSDITDVKLAQALDEQDPFAHFKAKFHLPKTEQGTDQIYFCGNSLGNITFVPCQRLIPLARFDYWKQTVGLQPKTAEEYVLFELKQWQTKAVSGHFVPGILKKAHEEGGYLHSCDSY